MVELYARPICIVNEKMKDVLKSRSQDIDWDVKYHTFITVERILWGVAIYPVWSQLKVYNEER